MKKRKLTGVIIALIVVIIIGVICIILVPKMKGEKSESMSSGDKLALTYSHGNMVVTEDMTNAKEIVDKKAAEGMIAVKMNANWFVSNDCSSSTIYLGNSLQNKYPLIFEIVLEETGEVLACSPEVPVGACVEKFGLDKELEPGDYDVLVLHHQIKDGEIYNTVTVAQVIHVQD